jgi:AmpD protein
VCAAIAQHYPIRHVAGHEHIAPGRKKDPGAGFQWAVLQRDLGWPAEWFPAVSRAG